jgi:hypothetical protein
LRPLALARNAFVAGREERVELVDRQRPSARVALELIQVRDQVALIKQLAGRAAELPLADHRPRVAPIAHVLREALQPPLIGAQRRARQSLRPRQQILEVLIDVAGAPLPRKAINVADKRAHAALVVLDRLGLQIARGLLRSPTVQHRLEHRLLQL